MSHPDVEIKIEGFKASSDLLTYLNAEMEKIRDLSPSDSRVELLVTTSNNEEKAYSGQLKVNSCVFNTVAKLSDNSLVDLVVFLFDGVHRKISRWKTLRFL